MPPKVKLTKKTSAATIGSEVSPHVDTEAKDTVATFVLANGTTEGWGISL